MALPAATPVTRPLLGFTVATDELLLLQVPPVVPPVLLNAVDKPAQTAALLTVPAVGRLVTVTSSEAVAIPHPLLASV